MPMTHTYPNITIAEQLRADRGETAWFAGFYCGSGSVKATPTLSVQVFHDDEQLLNTCVDLFGGTVVQDSRGKNHWSLVEPASALALLTAIRLDVTACQRREIDSAIKTSQQN